ncbi:MFS general substrate transporter [Hypoxylon sp. FL1284]|nr:MFS general substrate transporter [Hypoxylon sp. FL1284]
MRETIRESSLGQLARLLLPQARRLLPYPEELESFELPARLRPLADDPDEALTKHLDLGVGGGYSFYPTALPTVAEEEDPEAGSSRTWDSDWPSSTAATATAIATPRYDGRAAVEVGWYSDADEANPQNWGAGRKMWVTALMGLYTFSVYAGSSLYAPGAAQAAAAFGVGPEEETAWLGISLYVAGYGIGPLLWSPLSEIPAIGRTRIYAATLTAFAALALGAACIKDNSADGSGGRVGLAGLLILRFLLGIAGSPCLAAAGATLGDLYAPWKLPYVLVAWSAAATLGPALGPVASGFAVAARGWRWGGWELAWLAAPALVLVAATLPETSADVILHRRAARLRARTGRHALRCAADLERAHLTPRRAVADALVKPWQVNALDPAVLYTTVYASVLYATYYSFFEAFPLVFGRVYGFGLGQSGLPFLAFVPGLLVAVPGYCVWFRLSVEPVMRREPPPLYGHPESRMLPAVLTAFLAPVGLFIFAWTSRPDVHWFVPITGLTLMFIGLLVSFQCMNFYISRCYPKYSASLFAANTFARSCFAAGSIMFSTPMYKTLGVSGGVSLLGGLSILCAGGTIVLWRYGDRLRMRSRFAQSS